MMYVSGLERDQRYSEIATRLTEAVKNRLEPMFRAIHLNDVVLDEVARHIVADMLHLMRSEAGSPQTWLLGQWCSLDFAEVTRGLEAAAG